MRKTVKRAVTLIMVLLLVFLAACTPAPTPPPTPEPEPTADWGIIEIRVTDPPPADVEHVFVTLTNIEVHRVSGNTSGWETIIIDEVTFDLMDVIGVTAVLGSANVTAGSFTQIRLDVAEVDVVFVTDNITDNVTARVPSEKLKIVRPFTVGGGMTTVLTLDFDGKKSLILPGKDIVTGKERAIFKPVVHLLVEHSSSSASSGELSIEEGEAEVEEEEEEEEETEEEEEVEEEEAEEEEEGEE